MDGGEKTISALLDTSMLSKYNQRVSNVVMDLIPVGFYYALDNGWEVSVEDLDHHLRDYFYDDHNDSLIDIGVGVVCRDNHYKVFHEEIGQIEEAISELIECNGDILSSVVNLDVVEANIHGDEYSPSNRTLIMISVNDIEPETE